MPGDHPLSSQEASLKEGDYIVSLNGQPCKWWKHTEVVAQLRSVGDEGVSLQVVRLLPSPQPSMVSPATIPLPPAPNLAFPDSETPGIKMWGRGICWHGTHSAVPYIQISLQAHFTHIHPYILTLSHTTCWPETHRYEC